jgi:class 3 adenylate cyclase
MRRAASPSATGAVLDTTTTKSHALHAVATYASRSETAMPLLPRALRFGDNWVRLGVHCVAVVFGELGRADHGDRPKNGVGDGPCIYFDGGMST